MVRQRVFGIVVGYEDCNDFDTLCSDPLFKMAADRKPVTDADLASQPTLSRLENSIKVDELLKMAEFLVRLFINRHRRTADDNEQELLAAVLRPGNKHAGHGSVTILCRILPMLKEAFPACRFIVRGDAGFALPAFYNWCDQADLEYVISLPKNSRLRELSSDLEQEARDLFGQSKHLAASAARPHIDDAGNEDRHPHAREYPVERGGSTAYL
jgi:hypothetical protein